MAMDTAVSPLPNDIEALKALVLEATLLANVATQRAAEAEARLANVQAQASATEGTHSVRPRIRGLGADCAVFANSTAVDQPIGFAGCQ